MPSVRALAISWPNGNDVGGGGGGGGKLKFSGRFGKRLAIEFGVGTKNRFKKLF